MTDRSWVVLTTEPAAYTVTAHCCSKIEVVSHSAHRMEWAPHSPNLGITAGRHLLSWFWTRRSAHLVQCQPGPIGVLQTPMSWLHNTVDPFVAVLVDPVCGKRECGTQMRQSVGEMIAEAMAESQGRGASWPSSNMGDGYCRICGKTEGVMKCARCKAATYCEDRQAQG